VTLYLIVELQTKKENPETSRSKEAVQRRALVCTKNNGLCAPVGARSDPGWEGGRRKNSGRGEPGEPQGCRGRRLLKRSGGGSGPPVCVVTGGGLPRAARCHRKRISCGIRSSQNIPGGEWERAHPPNTLLSSFAPPRVSRRPWY